MWRVRDAADDGGAHVDGDRDQDFRAWVLSRREPLRRTAYLMCGDWYLADDLVQEATARVYSVWSRVASRGEPDAYARRVVVNLLTDHRRRPARRETPTQTLPDTARDDLDPAHAGGRDDVLRALAAVPPRQRAVLVLRFWEDLSVEETAALLGCSTGTVKSQTSRGLDALRAALAPLTIAEEIS
mgnify:CR=1 FL=1